MWQPSQMTNPCILYNRQNLQSKCLGDVGCHTHQGDLRLQVLQETAIHIQQGLKSTCYTKRTMQHMKRERIEGRSILLCRMEV